MGFIHFLVIFFKLNDKMGRSRLVTGTPVNLKLPRSRLRAPFHTRRAAPLCIAPHCQCSSWCARWNCLPLGPGGELAGLCSGWLASACAVQGSACGNAYGRARPSWTSQRIDYTRLPTYQAQRIPVVVRVTERSWSRLDSS